MARKGGGGGKPSPFDLIKNGVIEIVSSKEEWLDLGLIPSGQQYQLGACEFTPIDANYGVEVRINNTTKSTGTDANTTLMGKASAKSGVTKKIDMWRKGRMNTITVVSTGVEHWWLKFYSKKSATTEIIWNITYLELN